MRREPDAVVHQDRIVLAQDHVDRVRALAQRAGVVQREQRVLPAGGQRAEGLVHARLGCRYFLLGDKDRAVSEWTAARRDDPNIRADLLGTRAKGCKFMTLQRSHEMPQRYRLFVQWETVENHTKDFRESPDFHEWRKLVGHCFSTPPNVEHVVEVMRGF